MKATLTAIGKRVAAVEQQHALHSRDLDERRALLDWADQLSDRDLDRVMSAVWVHCRAEECEHLAKSSQLLHIAEAMRCQLADASAPEVVAMLASAPKAIWYGQGLVLDWTLAHDEAVALLEELDARQ